ncbi:MAG: aspartate dehydrogenase, partial [Methylobacterium sp.]
MNDRRVGVIGYGSIGRQLTAQWRAQPIAGFLLAAVLVRPHQQEEARAVLSVDIVVTADMDVFMDSGLDRVIEAAGQGAVHEHGEAVLRRGCDLMILSVGSLAAPGTIERLTAAARSTGRRVIVPVGAIAGLDGLMALR